MPRGQAREQVAVAMDDGGEFRRRWNAYRRAIWNDARGFADEGAAIITELAAMTGGAADQSGLKLAGSTLLRLRLHWLPV